MRYPSVPTGAGMPPVACWARRGPLTLHRSARHSVHVLRVGATRASPGRAERRGDRRAMTPHPVDTPHPASLALDTPSPARCGRGEWGEGAMAGRVRLRRIVWERVLIPGPIGPGGSGTLDPGGSRTRDPKGQARLTPTRGWRWSMGPVTNGQATVGNPPRPRRGAVCVTSPCRQARVCHRWRARPVEAPSPCIALLGTPSTFSL